MTAVVERDQRAALVAATRGVQRPAAPVPSGIRVLDPAPVERLLAAGEASPRQRTRALAVRVRQMLTELREQVESDHSARQAEDRVAALRKQLAQAEAQLRDARRRPVSTGSASGDDGERVDSRVVRQWAFANGVECPATGRVPARVIEAWRAAGAEDAAGGDSR